MVSDTLAPVCSQTQLSPDRSEAINQALSRVVMEEKAPGMIAAIISSRGVIASGAAGVRKAGVSFPIIRTV